MDLHIIIIVALIARASADSINHETDGQRVKFWIDVICTEGYKEYTAIYVLHGETYQSLNFFINLMSNIGVNCTTVLLLNEYKINSIYDVNNGNREYLNKKTINILIIEDQESFYAFLQSNALFLWRKNNYIIIMILWSNGEDASAYMAVCRSIFHALWIKHKIWNVLITFPLFTSNNVYFYNPYKISSEKTWGETECISVESGLSLLETLFDLTSKFADNLHGHALNIGIYDNKPQAFIPKEPLPDSIYRYSRGFVGMDGTLLAVLSKRMNFTVNVIDPNPDVVFGERLSNGTVTGYVGQLISGQVDAIFCASFMVYHCKGLCAIEYSVIVDADDICPIVPKAQKFPKWLQIFNAFEPTVWLFIFFSMIVASVLTNRIAVTAAQDSLKLFKHFLIIYELVVGTPGKVPSSTFSERIVSATMFLSGIVIMGSFTGCLYKNFSQECYYKDINNLAELDMSGLIIGVPVAIFLDTLGTGDTDETPYLRSLRQKVRLIHFPEAEMVFDRIANQRDIGTVARKSYFPTWSVIRSDEDGNAKMHLVLDCPRMYHLAYLLPKHSMLTEKFNRIILRLAEGGLVQRWKDQGIDLIISQSKSIEGQRKKLMETLEVDALSWDDLQSAFYILMIGEALAVIVLVGEKGWLGLTLANTFHND